MGLVLHKIISGGQTGVDRAALDAALELGFPCGGWCPCGRLAEDGPLPPIYPLRETETSEYAERTLRNVQEADATLVLCLGVPVGGTAVTIGFARKEGKPHLQLELGAHPGVEGVIRWLREHQVRVLNVAGPRESTAPGVYHLARDFMRTLLQMA